MAVHMPADNIMDMDFTYLQTDKINVHNYFIILRYRAKTLPNLLPN